VNFIPVADFSNINKCLYDSIPFTNQSTVAQGTIASYDWIFGDGGVSSNTNPYHTYTSCGVKAVTLVSTSDSGCVNAQTKQVIVFCKPTATIETADVCANITANFSGITSVSTDGTISAYSWNFGNGQTSSASTANISYLSGNYNVSLIVQSNNGCLDTTSVPIEIFPVPSAGFNVNDSCFGTSTCFTNTSSISSGNISSYCWDFNGSINTCESSNQTPCNIFPAVGTYNTTLITTSDKGCLDTITKTHTIFPLPVVNFSSSDVCIGNKVNFTNNTSISSGSIGNYSWNFGDNKTSNVVDPINNYLNSGTYSVSLIATSDKGCLDSLKKTVNVYPKPEANFESNLLEGCEPLCVNLNNLSTTNNNPPNSISQYFWEASNGWSSNSNSPTNVCFDAGDYDVKLTIVSDKGCSDTISFINYLHSYPLPVADFKFNPASTTILQSSITFVDESTGGKTISWDFGDNDTTYLIDGENLIHTYADTGEYIVTQIVISEYGCIDSIKKTVIIGPDWTFYIPNAFTPNEDGINDFYNGKGYGIKEYALIIFDRWGNLIARIDDINSKGWNGTVEPYSEPCQIDTYVYKVALTDVFDKRHYYTGTFHLVR
jgi:gliding motility-associated-like protein